MAHYAHINEQNIVDQVIVAEQDFINTGLVGDPNSWIQTSYNTRGGIHYQPDSNDPSEDQTKAFRKNFAGIGYFYDSNRDAFIPPKPFNTWILNEESCYWEAPVPFPNNGNSYEWDDETVSWVLE